MRRPAANGRNRIGTLACCALAGLVAAGSAFAQDTDVAAFRVGKVLTMDGDDRVLNNAIVLCADGKITAIGKAREINVPDGVEIVDMSDCWIVPGFVECHNHTAGGGDLHDYVYLTNPGLRTLDAVNPAEDAQTHAQAGGVTTALVISGSGTNMSGFGTVVKFHGDTPDQMVIKYPGSIKVAQAGNPERYWWGVGRTFMNYNTRQTLEKAKDYWAQWNAYENGEIDEQPEYDPIFDDFRAMYDQEFVASVHTQGYQVVMTTLDMLASKLGIPTVLDHSTFDGFKNAYRVNELPNVITINGPRQFHFDRANRKLHGNAARWWQGGVEKLGINTDAPVVPQRELPYQAAMACWFGWTPYEAIAGLTRVPAEALMVGDRVGSVEVGKDADFCIWSGDPLDPRSTCWITVIDGEIVYDGRKERRF